MPSITPEYAAIISKVLRFYKDKYGAGELGHEVYNNSPGRDRLHAMLASKIAGDNFNTVYLDSVKPDKME